MSTSNTNKDKVIKDLTTAAQRGQITPASASIAISNLDATVLPALIGGDLVFGTTAPSLAKFAIDASSSMGYHQQAMVDALNKVRERLVRESNTTGIEVLLSLTTFNDRVRTTRAFEDVLTMNPFTDSDYRPDGVTNLLGGIHQSLTELVAHGASGYVSGATGIQQFEIIFSDGMPVGPQGATEDEVRNFIAEFTSKKNSVVVFIGFGDESTFTRFARDLGILNIRVYDPSNPNWLDDLVLDISSGISSRSQQAAAGAPLSGNFFVT